MRNGAYGRHSPPCDSPHRHKLAFFDRDGDGLLDRNEAMLALVHFYPEASALDLLDILRRSGMGAGCSGDGRLTFDEFAAACDEAFAVHIAELAAEAADDDDDDDGDAGSAVAGARLESSPSPARIDAVAMCDALHGDAHQPSPSPDAAAAAAEALARLRALEAELMCEVAFVPLPPLRPKPEYVWRRGDAECPSKSAVVEGDVVDPHVS